ncbi:MAG: HD domain-containing protein [Anaerolineales bacterium]|jgi:putative hydrolase of HD superfamily
MNEERLERQIRFIMEIDKLKAIKRRSYILGGERLENTAEHSWHVVVLAMVLAEYTNRPVDLLHVLEMLAVHDLVEIDAGDTFCYDEEGNMSKARRETQAAERIFGLLPEDQRNEFQALWCEFEERSTAEAQFANAMDRTMPLLHNFNAQGRPWQEHNIRSDQVAERIAPIQDGAQTLWEYARKVVEDSIDKGYLSGADGV